MHTSSRLIENVKTPLRPFRHGAVAIARNILLERMFSDARIPQNLVISTGGAGTTFLMKHLAKFVEINDPFDGDKMKHLPRVPESWLEGRRVLYLYAAPDEVFRSIQRRKWLNMHAGELGSLGCQFTWGSLRQRLFEQAVKKQIDFFQGSQSENIMVLAYDDIWARSAEISTFFKISDARFISEFPKRRPRTIGK